MPNSVGSSQPGNIRGKSSWLERAKQFGKWMSSKTGTKGSIEVSHEPQLGEGKLSQQELSIHAKTPTNAERLLSRESIKKPTQGHGRAAQYMRQDSFSTEMISGQTRNGLVDTTFSKEIEFINHLLEQHQSGKTNSIQMAHALIAELNNPEIHIIDGLNQLNNEGKLGTVLDALPMSAVAFLGCCDVDMLGEHIFGKLQPIVLDSFDEQRWEESEAEGMGGMPLEDYQGGYLQRRIESLEFDSMSPAQRQETIQVFREIMEILYESYNK